MRSTFNVIFYIKRTSLKRNGNAPIMARITLNGEVKQLSVKSEVHPDNWNVQSGKAIGKEPEIKQLNNLLDNIKANIINHYWQLVQRDSYVTAEKVRNAFLGIEVHKETLLKVFEQHNKNLELQIEKGVKRDTYKKYERTYVRLQEFIKQHYNLSDIILKDVNYSFLCEFETYLKTVHNCGQNTAAKFMQRIRTIIIIAKNNGWITVDPFINYKISLEKTDRAYLTDKELERIMNKNFSVKRLETVRDIFIFSCFCGLAYIDVFNIKESNIITGFDDKLWIVGKRVKSGVSYRVPLLEVPKMIIEKYRGTQPNGLLLPVISNQKMNAYLKEIADICEIDKNLTFHVARHTFATTVTLSKGVSIESVSKMLGHTNIKTTQIYARITDNKIGDDMAVLADKLKVLESKFASNQ